MRLHECDVCGTEYKHHAPTVDFDPAARAVGGNMHYQDGMCIEWPLRETRVDVCPECCQVVAAALRERRKEGDSR